MSILRKASVWVLAMTLVGFAHPALAQKSQTKYGSVNFQPLLSGSSTVTVEVKFFNSTPKPGVSTINSAWAKITNAASLPDGLGVAGVQKLTISDGTVDTSVTAKNMSGALCTTSNPCKEFTITDFTGIGNNLSGTFLLTLVGVPEACVNILWDAEANTGNSYPGGDPFLLTKYNLSTGCDGTLACWDGTSPIPANAMFNGSVFGASDDTDSGYFAGFRAADWKGTCPLVPFKTYNNVGGTTSLLDAFNTTVPPNFAVINYTASATNGVLIAHTITFAVELSGTNGVPSSSRATFYCVQGTDCTGANRKPALGCTSPAIAITSIPFVGSVQEPGCVRGASWVIVPASDPRCDAINGTSTTQTCVQWAVDFLEAKDPPWGRGEL